MNSVCIDPSYGYMDIESNNYGYNGDVVITTGTDYEWPSLTTKGTNADGIVITTTTPNTIDYITVDSSKYKYTTLTTVPEYHYNNNSIIISAPIEKEKVIKNISVLKCKCCDAKLDAKKMKNNIIKCEYCDSDNYINME